MGTVNGLQGQGTSSPTKVGERGYFILFISSTITLVDREAGLSVHFLFYNPLIYYFTPFFLLLYIY